MKHISEILPDVVMDLAVENFKFHDISSGIMGLDEVTDKWQEGDLIALASLPGIELSELALQFLWNAATNQHVPSLYFSIKRPDREIARILQVYKGCEELSLHPIFIDDTPKLSIDLIKERVEKALAEKNVQFVVIDSLSLIQGPLSLREDSQKELLYIVKELKLFAREKGIAIMVLVNVPIDGRENANSMRYWPYDVALSHAGNIDDVADKILILEAKNESRISSFQYGSGWPSEKRKLIVINNCRKVSEKFFLNRENDNLRFNNLAEKYNPSSF